MSSQITTELIKELRDATGISVMQCKRALEEASGDTNKALAILKKTSSDIALKKADRQVKDGAIMVKMNSNKIAMVTLLCETDFVSKNEDFTNLLSKITNMVLSNGVEKIKIEATDIINEIIQKTGENIQLSDTCLMEGSVLGYYVHNAKSGVIVSLEGGSSELAKDIAMHIAAMKPEYITKDDINAETIKMITEVFEKEVASIDKPTEIKKKMLEGKIGTYFKEKTLLDQLFIKNPDKTIGKLLENAKAKIKEMKHYTI